MRISDWSFRRVLFRSELHRLLRPEASEVLQLPLHRQKPGRIDRQVELRPVGLAREERPQEGSSSTFARTLLDVGDSLSRTSSSASSGTGSTVMPLKDRKSTRPNSSH